MRAGKQPETQTTVRDGPRVLEDVFLHNAVILQFVPLILQV